MKKKLLGFVMAVLCLVLALGAFTACNDDPPAAPEGGLYSCYSENKVYTLYYLLLTFEEDGTFHVDKDSDVWIRGKWSFAGKPGESVLTLSEADVAIPGIEKNGSKTYEPENGVYTIVFDHGGGTTSTYKLKPSAGSSKPPCNTHVDNNGDGTCDNCGETMPQEEAHAQVVMNAKASATIPDSITVNADAQIKVFTNNTWKMYIKTDVPNPNADFAEAASGTWTLNTTTNVITLTVAEQTAQNSLADTLTVSCDASGYPNLVYTATVAYTSNGLTFNFGFSNVEPQKISMVTLTATKSIEPYPNYTVNAEAKIEIYTDNTWAMFIKTDADPSKTDFEKAASGTYTNTQTEMTLTVTELTVDGSEMADNITVAVNSSGYPTIAYTTTVTYTNVRAFEFSFTGALNMQ